MCKTLYKYIDDIFSFYEKSSLGAGQGLFLRRSIRTKLNKSMASKDERYIYDLMIATLCLNNFLEDNEDKEFVKLTKKGEQYIRGAKDVPINPYLHEVIQYSQGKNWLVHELWLMVGDQEVAPFYIEDSLLYETIVSFINNKKSYADYIQTRRDEKLSVHRSAWFEDLLDLIPKEKWKDLLIALSKTIEQEYYSNENKNDYPTRNEDTQPIYPKMKTQEVKIEIKDQANVVFQTSNGDNTNFTADVNPSKKSLPHWALIVGYIAVAILIGVFVLLCWKEYQVNHDISAVLASKHWEKWISTVLAVILLVLKQIFK